MFCKHDWKLLSETTTKSKFEVAMETIGERCGGKVTVPHQMSNANRKHIQTFTCNKCGGFKRFVENI